MSIRERIRNWLGLEEDALELRDHDHASKQAHFQVVKLFTATEKAQRERHIELLAALRGIEEHVIVLRDTLPRIEQMFHTEHINRRHFAAPVVDFESGQLAALADMLANPPKEEN